MPLAGGGHQPGALGSPMPSPRNHFGHLDRAAEPEVVRRHGHDGVVVQERDQRRDVVALEGVDVAGQQRLLVGGRRRGLDGVPSGRGVARVARARWRALFTDATVVSSSSATSVACQRRTSRRMSTARWRAGRCWRAVTKARRIVSRGRGHARPGRRRRGAPGRRGWAAPRRSPAGWRPGRRRRWPPARGPWPGPGAGGPAACRGRRWWRCGRATSAPPSGPRSGRAPPGPDHRLLHGVLGLEGRAEHPVAVAGQLPAVLLEVLDPEVRTDGHRWGVYDEGHGSAVLGVHTW